MEPQKPSSEEELVCRSLRTAVVHCFRLIFYCDAESLSAELSADAMSVILFCLYVEDFAVLANGKTVITQLVKELKFSLIVCLYGLYR